MLIYLIQHRGRLIICSKNLWSQKAIFAHNDSDVVRADRSIDKVLGIIVSKMLNQFFQFQNKHGHEKASATVIQRTLKFNKRRTD